MRSRWHEERQEGGRGASQTFSRLNCSGQRGRYGHQECDTRRYGESFVLLFEISRCRYKMACAFYFDLSSGPQNFAAQPLQTDSIL